MARYPVSPRDVCSRFTALSASLGEVYRARDTRLDRDVAIKVLPELLAADPDRLARFAREALASLSHPHIAYAPTGLVPPKRAEREGGHLVFARGGSLFAVRFDPATLAG